MVRLDGYLCLAVMLAGLAIWLAAYVNEPRTFLVIGDLKALEVRGTALVPGLVVPSLSLDTFGSNQNQAFAGLNQSIADLKVDEGFINRSRTLLLERYGPSVNITKTMIAVQDGPSGRQTGIGFVVDLPVGRRLVLFLMDGSSSEYSVPTPG